MKYGPEFAEMFIEMVDEYGARKARDILEDQGFAMSLSTLYSYTKMREKYPDSIVKQMKIIVQKHGLLRGCEYINSHGLIQDYKVIPYSISVPTLSKLIKSDKGGKPLVLPKGRKKAG